MKAAAFWDATPCSMPWILGVLLTSPCYTEKDRNITIKILILIIQYYQCIDKKPISRV
jgi:hypothetical protein